jgi:hypothetical protein
MPPPGGLDLSRRAELVEMLEYHNEKKGTLLDSDAMSRGCQCQ